jgi:hypothetical protein
MSAEAHFEQYLYLAEVTDQSALFTGGGDVRLKTPQKFVEAKTEAWGIGGHFLIVKIEGNRMEIRPIGETADLPIEKPGGQKVDSPIVVTK